MNELVSQAQTNSNQENSTNMGRFLAKRGMLLMKETRDFASIRCEYGDKINVVSYIISTAATVSSKSEVTYGLRFEHIDPDGRPDGSGFLDFDEFDEFTGALNYLESLAQQMMRQQRDYTEVTYSSKDNVKFGFFQTEGRQQAFFDVRGYNENAFLPVGKLQMIQRAVESVKAHLISRGAEN